MTGVRLAGLIHELPPARLDDAELAGLLGLDGGEIRRHSRGRLRHSASDGQGPADLAAAASRRLLDEAVIEAADIDFIVFATNTPDLTFPGSACLLQHRLGAATVGCLDIRAQCAGFVAALDVASRFVDTGTYRRVLLASADVPTHINRYDGVDPEAACLTGDASAVALLEAGTGAGEVLACCAEVDGSRRLAFWCEFPASRHRLRDGVVRGERATRRAFEEGRFYPQIDLDALDETARARVPDLFDRVLDAAGLATVDALIVAHLDPRTEETLCEGLAPKAGRLVEGDTVYALGTSLPLRLARAIAADRVESGETVGLVTAGAGASWGAAIVRV